MTDYINYKIQEKDRIVSLIVLVAIIVVMLFSSCYIIKEENHDCSEASCPVCAVIQQCEDNLRQIGSGIIAKIAVAVLVFFLCSSISLTNAVFCRKSPITRKVRLNN